MNRIWQKLGALLRRRGLDAELDEELRFHLDAQVEENVRAGMSPAEARRVALRDFGGVEQTKEAHRDVRGIRWIAEVVHDGRFAFRMLRRNPGFTAVALLTLALGLGANMAIFSLIHVATLKPLPFPEPDRLVRVQSILPLGPNIDAGEQHNPFVNWPHADELCEQSQSFVSCGFYRGWQNTLTGVGEPALVSTLLVSPELFRTLDIKPAIGRAFLPGETDPGAGNVVILSDGCWRDRFGHDPDILGKTISLNSNSYTVVGIMPDGFRMVLPNIGAPEIYVPLNAGESLQHTVLMVARLRPGTSIEAAQEETDAIRVAMADSFSRRSRESQWELVSLQDEFGRELRTALLILLGAAVFVLAIGCANLGNLILARSVARQKELGMRATLGAGRGRIARQLLTESVLLWALGGIGGLLLSSWMVRLVIFLYPGHLPRVAELEPEPALFAFGFGLAMATGILVGLVPAWRLSRCDLGASVKAGGSLSVSGPRINRWRQALVAAEVALAIMLLAGASLLLRSFLSLRVVDPEFRRENLTIVNVRLPNTVYSQPQQQTSFVNRLVSRLDAMPGVLDAGITNTPPMMANFVYSVSVSATGQPEEDDPHIKLRAVTPDYLRAMGIPLLAGRYLEPADAARGGSVLLNRSAARQLFGSLDPLGRRIRFIDQEWTIVGIVADVKNAALDQDTDPEMYVPFEAVPNVFLGLAIHSTADPATVVSGVRTALRSLDPNLALDRVATTSELIDEDLAEPRFYTTLLGAFAGLALLLACLGVYGVIAQGVAWRTREIGIRMALGARAGDVVRMVVARGLVAPVIGVILGAGGALAATPVLRSFLYGVKPNDPITYVVVIATLLVVAVAAAAIPAWRGSRVNPTVALRCE